MIQTKGLSIAYELDIPSEPTWDFLQEQKNMVIDLLKNPHYGVLAIGGGSVIDGAKAIIQFSKDSLCCSIGINDKIRISPLIVVPSTAGTGSEVTKYSVIKKGLIHKVLKGVALVPKIAFIDGSLQETVPSNVKAFTAIDALSHSIETFVSPKANNISRSLSINAFLLIVNNIQQHCLSYNIHVSQKISESATIAGIANQLVGCGLIHAMAYALSEQLDIPHGLAIALCMPIVIKFIEKRMPYIYQKLLNHLNNQLISLENTSSFILRIIKSLPINFTKYSHNLNNLDLKLATKRTNSIERLAKNIPVEYNLSELYRMFEEVVNLWKN